MKDEEGQHQSDHDTELIHRNHLGSFSNLKRSVVADPGSACCQTGQDQEQPALFADLSDASLSVGDEDHDPGHDHNHYGADGSCQIRVDSFNADLGQNRCQGSEDGGEKRVSKPHKKSSFVRQILVIKEITGCLYDYYTTKKEFVQGNLYRDFFMKKQLTFSFECIIVYEVAKVTGRKVGIHLTSARESDPGLYLSYIANSLCPWIGG